ncbi:UDP-N-acetylmuramoyl-L-alanine--D-glutamate ligase [Candidatus Poribacteria bacterium]|nr:UDP-N-acetylmuramoyl-L-alanine--D-glutamate ligase [Candidatus Poribacteria bacterium]
MQLQGKRVTVFGLNRSGIAAAKLLYSQGAVVTLTDTRSREALSAEIDALTESSEPSKAETPNSRLLDTCNPYRTYFSGHPLECITDADLIVVSPGVPLDIPILCAARARNLPILAELEVAADVCPAPIIAITGTKGKSTTTLLTAAILKSGGRFPNVRVAGNIGVPLAAEVQNLTSRDIVVVEASSFQLESTVNFHPKVSVVLNLSRDHLDRHGTMSSYRDAKQKISDNQTPTDWIVLNDSDASIKDFATATSAKVVYFTDKGAPKNSSFSGTFRVESGLFAQQNGIREKICDIVDIPLPGAHNVRNVLAAIAVGRIFGVTGTEIRDAFQGFDRSHPALSHAFELVRVLEGVRFINDSKATNVSAVKAALESLGNSQVLLIMGGYDKGNDYTPLREIVQTQVKGAIMLGEYTQQIEKSLANTTKIMKAKTMAEAVQVAHKHASSGDVVLLSPANASFDMYSDYKARGTDFKEAVDALHPKHSNQTQDQSTKPATTAQATRT